MPGRETVRKKALWKCVANGSAYRQQPILGIDSHDRIVVEKKQRLEHKICLEKRVTLPRRMLLVLHQSAQLRRTLVIERSEAIFGI